MAWYNSSGWNYRKAIIINNNSGGALTDYQIKVTVTFVATKMNADFSDIRFAYDNGTDIPYWLESKTNSSAAAIWIKVNLPLYGTPSPSGDNTVYMYYGNSLAASTSNGTDTFIVYDNFSGGTIDPSVWSTHVGSGGTISQTGGEMVHTGDSDWSGANHYTVKTFNKTDKLIIDFRIRYPSAYGNGGNNQNLYIFNTGQITWTPSTYDDPSGTVTYISLTGGNGVTYDTTWRVTLLGNGNYSLQRLAGTGYISDITNQPLPSWVSISNPITLDFNSGTYGGSRNTYYDDTIIRKYASPEPAVSTIGTEQTPPNIGATNMSITPSESPCRTGICTVTVVIRWSNSGGSDGTVTPNIKIDNISQTAHSPRNVIAGSYIDETFTLSGLPAGTHAICPDPN